MITLMELHVKVHVFINWLILINCNLLLIIHMISSTVYVDRWFMFYVFVDCTVRIPHCTSCGNRGTMKCYTCEDGFEVNSEMDGCNREYFGCILGAANIKLAHRNMINWILLRNI